MKRRNDASPFKILEVVYQRKALAAAVFFVVFVLSAYLAVSLPNVYRSSTLIMVIPQRLPANYVAPTVTQEAEERVRSVTEQIQSRTGLQKIIKEFNLYSRSRGPATMEERIERLRKSIKVEIGENISQGRRRGRGGGGSAESFRLSFEFENPETSMRVTSRLASLFIEENLQVREQQAMGTTSFINAETDRLGKDLQEQEAQVNRYKAENRFELPEQLGVNLRAIEQLHSDLQNNLLRLSALQERKANLEKELIDRGSIATVTEKTEVSLGTQNISPSQQLESRRTELKTLRVRYGERHPDIIRLKQEIETLEGESAIQEHKTKGSGSIAVPSVGPSGSQLLPRQIADLSIEINGLAAKNQMLQAEIAMYKRRVDNTPLRAIELSKISRGYDITLKKYQDLLAKRLESQISENMEKTQKGERFLVVDPANFPQKPAKPNRPLIIIVGLLGGLGAGLGLAFILGTLGTSFKTANEVGDYVDLPVLAAIPTVFTRESIMATRRAHRILVFSSAGTVAVGIVFIRLFGASLLLFF